MLSFRLTEKAIEDMKNIGRYTQKRYGIKQRNRFLSMLDRCFHMLTREPDIGKACDDIRDGYRKYHVQRHLIFCRQRTTHIEIIRILHDRMDVESHL